MIPVAQLLGRQVRWQSGHACLVHEDVSHGHVPLAVCSELGPYLGLRRPTLRQLGIAALVSALNQPVVSLLTWVAHEALPAGLVEGLATEGVHVAARLGRLRVSPHVYNDEADVDSFVAALARRLRS